MKRKIKSLTGFSIGATDGEIGNVKEFYFDDETWTIRYLIVETGGWLFGRKVLISPHSIQHSDWENKIFEANLTKEQVRNSPDIDTDKPISRQHEILLNQYYPWPSYWGDGLWAGGLGVTGMMAPVTLPLEQAVAEEAKSPNEKYNPHLRSTSALTGYSIKATDGDIGEIEDFLIDEDRMKIDFIVVDTGAWLPGKKVLLSPDLIKEINWNSSKILVNATVEQVRTSPEYDADRPMDDEYVASHQSHYGGFTHLNQNRNQ